MKINDVVLLLKVLKNCIRYCFPNKNKIGFCGANTIIEYPFFTDSPQNIYIEENVKIRHNCKIINSTKEKVTIKKYSVLAPGCTIICNSHVSTVGIPQFLLGASHINDKSKDIVIEEDVWIGANVTIMPGIKIGRGAIVGACSLVTKDVPPYALVCGSPAKIVQKNFMLEDVLEHEKQLYNEEERLSFSFLTELYEEKYKDFKVYGCNKPLAEEQKVILEKTMIENKFIQKKEIL